MTYWFVIVQNPNLLQTILEERKKKKFDQAAIVMLPRINAAALDGLIELRSVDFGDDEMMV